MPTPIDTAHAAMTAAPEDDGARLAFYARLAEAELYLLLDEEPTGDDIAPRVLETETGGAVLAFDGPSRLIDYAGAAAPYAALPGKALAGLLAGQGVGLALNPGVAPSDTLLPPDAVDWLAGVLEGGADETEAAIAEIGPPGPLPDAILAAIDNALGRAGGLAESAWLVTATETAGRKGPLLALVEPAPGSETALARMLRDTVALSGAEAGFLDVAFFGRDHPVVPVLKRQGLRFELPEPETAPEPAPPGLDPASPPKLR